MTASSGDKATKPVAIENGLPKTEDEVIENFRPLSVIVIGAGFSGIYLGVRIPQRLRNVKLTIYEKNAGVGGTWYENRYPGCACDIPGAQITFLNSSLSKLTKLKAHSYQYTFAPNPDWSSFYAPAQEIREYLESVVRRYSVDRFVKCLHKVVDVRWDDEKAKW
jgi:cation diffusion facilitator CzcD-associated flavoprotein CzcO